MNIKKFLKTKSTYNDIVSLLSNTINKLVHLSLKMFKIPIYLSKDLLENRYRKSVIRV